MIASEQSDSTPKSISHGLLEMIQNASDNLSSKSIMLQPKYLDLLDALIKVAKEDWRLNH